MNYFTIYTDLVDTISVYNIEKLVDDTNGLTGEQARAILAKAEELERQIAMFRAELKQETQFNRKMELNLIIKDLESQRKSF